MIARGSFDVKITPRSEGGWMVDGVSQGTMSVEKVFVGDLVGQSAFDMHAVRTPHAGSACYVALERIECVLEGKKGSFVVAHFGMRDRGSDRLQVDVVPDSGTGELRGLRGTMRIEIHNGEHMYELEYRYADQ